MKTPEVQELETKLASVTTALRELEGFAKRNVERARRALEATAPKSTDHIESKARLHEAERVYLVIRERVREALQ